MLLTVLEAIKNLMLALCKHQKWKEQVWYGMVWYGMV